MPALGNSWTTGSAFFPDLPAIGFTGRYSGWIDLLSVHNGLLMSILRMIHVFWKRHSPGAGYCASRRIVKHLAATTVGVSNSPLEPIGGVLERPNMRRNMNAL